MGPALSVRDLSKRFGPVAALSGVSFDVAPGSIHALVGANGSGKSTLIRVVAGIDRAEPGGSVSVGGEHLPLAHLTPQAVQRAGVRVVHQASTIFPDLTVAENIGVGSHLATRPGGSIRWRDLHQQAAQLLGQLGLQVSPREVVGDLSPAVQTLVAVARAFAGAGRGDDVQLMILDEPTAALPAREVEILLAGLRRLADDGTAVMLVTHRLDEVARSADRATVLRDGRHVATFDVGSVRHDEVVDMITGGASTALASPGTSAGGTPLLEVVGLQVGPVHDLNLTLHAGEVLGIGGLLGSGRSSVLEALFGARRRRAGTVTLDGALLDLRSPARAMKAGLALVPEQRQRAVFAEQTVAENLSITDLPRWWNGLRLNRAGERGAAEDDVAGFGIVAHSPGAAMDTLSGGNQQKVVVARALRRTPQVLLLDEPTLGVDVGARGEIHQMVRQYLTGGAGGRRGAVMVSSDVEELCAVADRILVLHRGRPAQLLDAAATSPEDLNRLVHREVAA
jgi:ribose transport system ATP-binding protein